MEYVDLPISDEASLKIIFEMSVGDLVISSLLAGIGLYLIIQAVVRALWRG